MKKKEEFIIIAAFVILVFISILAIARAQENQLVMKFHSEGEGKNVSLNLKKFFPDAKDFFYSAVQNVSIEISNGIAVITPKIGWRGEELIIFSPNESLVVWKGGMRTNVNVTNIEPMIEMSFPDVNYFDATPGNLEFSIAVFDPDNDFLNIEWFVNGTLMKGEDFKGGGISRFNFTERGNASKGTIVRGYNLTQEVTIYKVQVIINDSKNIKTNEWRFNILNVTCFDFWKCGNWSECIDGKRYRNCIKSNPDCRLNNNKPSTEWFDITCGGEFGSTCSPNWTCGEWGSCTINYNKGIIKKGIISESINTKQERICYDTNFCVGGTGIEIRDCQATIPITVRQAEWCSDKYIEIYNADTGLLVSRIRKSKIENQGFDIDLSLSDLARMKTCWYCFDGIRDYDETGIDCGGTCEDCSLHNIYVQRTIFDYRTPILIVVDIFLVVVLFRFSRMR